MHAHLLLLHLLLLGVSFSAHGEGRDSMIELHVHCSGGNPCPFSGEMINVELELFNAGSAEVALPLEYFRQQGPKVILVDNHSGKEKRIGMGPPMSYLFDEMQALAPGQSIKIPWMVAPDQIDAFALRPVDITASFTFFVTPRVPMPETQFVTTQLHIVDGRLGD